MKRMAVVFFMISALIHAEETSRERGSIERSTSKGIVVETFFHTEDPLILDDRGEIELLSLGDRIELLPEHTRVDREGSSMRVRTYISHEEMVDIIPEEIDIEEFNSGISFGIRYPFRDMEMQRDMEAYFSYVPEDKVDFTWENKNLNIFTDLAPGEKFSMEGIRLLSVENIGEYKRLKRLMNISVDERGKAGEGVELKEGRESQGRRVNPMRDDGESFGEIEVNYTLVQEGKDMVLYFSQEGRAPEKSGTYSHVEVIEVTFK